MSPRPLLAVAIWWALLGAVAVLGGNAFDTSWSEWRWAFAAAAMWGANVTIVIYGLGAPFRLSRPPVLAAGIALLMTVLGSASYWATIQIYPLYRVGIERAAAFVATCTFIALATVAVARVVRPRTGQPQWRLEWSWEHLTAVVLGMFCIAFVGTIVTLGRIGYIPILSGDPSSARVDFPALGGVWYRMSMLGGVAAMLVGAKAAARRATIFDYVTGAMSLGLVGLYGPRFFVALPIGVSALLWDRVRARLPIARAVAAGLIAIPLLALVGFWRDQALNVLFLGPVGLAVYGALGEFRDLGWALDYYGLGDHFVHGETLGSLIVPLLPSPVWTLFGIDKAAVYARNSASILADAMGQTTGQRIGAYGEFFMNFGWTGAVGGAVLYGLLLWYLDDQFEVVNVREVRGVFLALAIAAAVFAQIGQLNMFTSTLTGFGYPLALAALIAARKPRAA
jgi:hypothetical protein